MSEFLNKLSSYNIFNYLLPGVIFSLFASATTKYVFIQTDIIIGLFFYYFVGLVISRIGSLAVEPLFKKLGLIEVSSYSDFIVASDNDEKIEVLSEANNSYRSIVSVFLMLVMLNAVEAGANAYTFIDEYIGAATTFFLLVIFSFSYRKQTSYIVKRIDHANKQTKRG